MVLYGAKGGNAASDLYTIDPTTGVASSVGPTGRALTGLAFHPGTGVLYGSTTNNSPLNARSLVIVDPTTGATTLVGSFGVASDTMSDIAFDSNGVLYGICTDRKLYTINLGTGTATQVSAVFLGFYGNAMDFDSEDNLFLLPDGDQTGVGTVQLVDQVAGTKEQYALISGSPPYDNGAAFSAGTFAPAKIFYAIDNDFGASAHLVTVDMTSGDVVDIGVTTTGMDAIASDTRATEAYAYRFDATDIINPDSTSASIVGGCVQEDWRDWWDFGSNGYNLPQQTFKFTWTNPAGVYKVKVTGHLSAAGSGSVTAVASVNGRPFLGPNGLSFSGTTSSSFFLYNGFDAGTDDVYNDTADYERDPWLVLTPGDLVEIQIMSAADLTGFAGFNAFQTCLLRFDIDTPSSSSCTGAISFPDEPLGDDWGDVDGWGGQRLVPDEIYTILGYTPDSHVTGVDFPWGIGFMDYDMVALPDGTVYVIIHDALHVTGDPLPPTVPASQRHFIVVKKYDPGGGTWSQITTLNIRPPTDCYQGGSVTCEYDGTYVYFAWWELTTYTSGTPKTYQSDWHLVRLDPSDDSTTELGTGQHSVNVGTGASDETDNAELGTGMAILAPNICVSGDDIYVGVVELVRTVPGSSFAEWRRPFIWRWDGATWTNLSLPDPSLLGPVSTRWEITGENQFWDQLTEMVAADQNGPITDGFTLVYSYQYLDGLGTFRSPTVTIPYTTGGGWGTEILTDWMTLEAGRQATAVAPPDNVYLASLIDHTIMWGDTYGKLVLAGDLFVGPSDGIWDTWVMNDAGTQWEIMEPVAPASSSGGWRNSRNSADIGPDGLIYRGMASAIIGTDFFPHVLKHSPGYTFGYANGQRKPIGRIVTWDDPQGNDWSGSYIFMSGTSNFRIRWVGNSCYIMGNLYVEPQLVNDQFFAAYAGDWPFGEGYFVIKGTYVPCGGNIPLFRPRVFSVSDV